MNDGPQVCVCVCLGSTLKTRLSVLLFPNGYSNNICPLKGKQAIRSYQKLGWVKGIKYILSEPFDFLKVETVLEMEVQICIIDGINMSFDMIIFYLKL